MLLPIFWDYPELISFEYNKTSTKLYNLDIVRVNKYSQQKRALIWLVSYRSLAPPYIRVSYTAVH